MNLYFVRHGEVHNPKELFYGRLPRFRLSARGVAQSKELGAFFAQRKPIDALYSSPQLRARQTARALAGDTLHIPVRITRLIAEVRTPYDGLPVTRLAERGWDVYAGTGPEYEQPQHVLDRSLRFLQQARRIWAGGSVIAVTHAAVIYFLAMWVNHKALDPNAPEILRELGLPQNYPPHASVTQFTFQTDDPAEIPTMRYFS